MDKINSIKKACRITDEVFSLLLKNIKEFRTERDIRLFIIRAIRKKGHKIAFTPIVASDKNAANPHHRGDAKLKKGFCVIDLGAEYNGYCSDMTRTVYLGRPTKREKELYNKVLGVQKKAIRLMKVGKGYGDVCTKVRKILGKRQKYFIHALGHGVGRKIHEKPKVSCKSKDIVKVNEIITIEPGLYYKKKLGIRIEDTILIKRTKTEILTKTKKGLIYILKTPFS